jgi:murein DD-endopeptidase MepM/ murein hydrolase activator NlpD
LVTKLLSKLPLKLSLFLFVILLGAGAAYAQGNDPQDPQYVVQPGDTLSSIALRFDVSQQEIIQASNLANPDALNVGDVLTIPGIDWVEGVLTFTEMPLGESLLSLQRRYRLPAESITRLNRITSPDQLYAGLPVLLATQRGELVDTGRALVAPEVSLLEIAVANGDNPWAISALNQLPGTWAAVPGDVLFTPARQAPGPGGLPSPITALEVDAPGFVQGHTVVLTLAAPDDLELGGDLVGNPLHFFSESEGAWVTLQGIPLEAGSGIYSLTISGLLGGEAPFAFSQPIRVQSGGFERFNLFVDDPALLDPERSAAESEQVREIMSALSSEKLWEGRWGWPHNLVNEVTSGFGEFRTYNGGLAESYHYGVDFGGGALLEIFAPAPGRVIFAGPLDIRGNATIIDHGWGIFTGYWHQQEIYVAEGDMVKPGEVIGIVGGTGRVKGPHLHWEVWANGVPIEPLDWLERAFP